MAEETAAGWAVDISVPEDGDLEPLLEDELARLNKNELRDGDADAPDDWDLTAHVEDAFGDLFSRAEELIVEFADNVAAPQGDQGAFEVDMNDLGMDIYHLSIGAVLDSKARDAFRPYWNSYDTDALIDKLVNDAELRKLGREGIDGNGAIRRTVLEQATITVYYYTYPPGSGDASWFFTSESAADHNAENDESATAEGYGIYRGTATLEDWIQYEDNGGSDLNTSGETLINEVEGQPTPDYFTGNGGSESVFVLEGSDFDEEWRAYEQVSSYEARRRNISAPNSYDAAIVDLGTYPTKAEAAQALLQAISASKYAGWQPILYSENNGGGYAYIRDEKLKHLGLEPNDDDDYTGTQLGLPGVAPDEQVGGTYPQKGDYIIWPDRGTTTVYTDYGVSGQPNFSSTPKTVEVLHGVTVWQYLTPNTIEAFDTLEDAEAYLAEQQAALGASLPQVWEYNGTTFTKTFGPEVAPSAPGAAGERSSSYQTGYGQGLRTGQGQPGEHAGPNEAADYRRGVADGARRHLVIMDAAKRDQAQGAWNGAPYSGDEGAVYAEGWRQAEWLASYDRPNAPGQGGPSPRRRTPGLELDDEPPASAVSRTPVGPGRPSGPGWGPGGLWARLGRVVGAWGHDHVAGGPDTELSAADGLLEPSPKAGARAPFVLGQARIVLEAERRQREGALVEEPVDDAEACGEAHWASIHDVMSGRKAAPDDANGTEDTHTPVLAPAAPPAPPAPDDTHVPAPEAVDVDLGSFGADDDEDMPAPPPDWVMEQLETLGGEVISGQYTRMPLAPTELLVTFPNEASAGTFAYMMQDDVDIMPLTARESEQLGDLLAYVIDFGEAAVQEPQGNFSPYGARKTAGLEIYEGDFYQVDANHGETTSIPVNVHPGAKTQGDLRDYVFGDIDDPDEPTTVVHGWAVGTDGDDGPTVFDTELEAQQHIWDFYEVDPFSGRDAYDLKEDEAADVHRRLHPEEHTPEALREKALVEALRKGYQDGHANKQPNAAAHNLAGDREMKDAYGDGYWAAAGGFSGKKKKLWFEAINEWRSRRRKTADAIIITAGPPSTIRDWTDQELIDLLNTVGTPDGCDDPVGLLTDVAGYLAAIRPYTDDFLSAVDDAVAGYLNATWLNQPGEQTIRNWLADAFEYEDGGWYAWMETQGHGVRLWDYLDPKYGKLADPAVLALNFDPKACGKFITLHVKDAAEELQFALDDHINTLCPDTSDDADEKQEDDYWLTESSSGGYAFGTLDGKLTGGADTLEGAERRIKEWMEASGYFPNVWDGRSGDDGLHEWSIDFNTGANPDGSRPGDVILDETDRGVWDVYVVQDDDGEWELFSENVDEKTVRENISALAPGRVWDHEHDSEGETPHGYYLSPSKFSAPGSHGPVKDELFIDASDKGSFEVVKSNGHGKGGTSTNRQVYVDFYQALDAAKELGAPGYDIWVLYSGGFFGRAKFPTISKLPPAPPATPVAEPPTDALMREQVVHDIAVRDASSPFIIPMEQDDIRWSFTPEEWKTYREVYEETRMARRAATYPEDYRIDAGNLEDFPVTNLADFKGWDEGTVWLVVDAGTSLRDDEPYFTIEPAFARNKERHTINAHDLETKFRYTEPYAPMGEPDPNVPARPSVPVAPVDMTPEDVGELPNEPTPEAAPPSRGETTAPGRPPRGALPSRRGGVPRGVRIGDVPERPRAGRNPVWPWAPIPDVHGVPRGRDGALALTVLAQGHLRMAGVRVGESYLIKHVVPSFSFLKRGEVIQIIAENHALGVVEVKSSSGTDKAPMPLVENQIAQGNWMRLPSKGDIVEVASVRGLQVTGYHDKGDTKTFPKGTRILIEGPHHFDQNMISLRQLTAPRELWKTTLSSIAAYTGASAINPTDVYVMQADSDTALEKTTGRRVTLRKGTPFVITDVLGQHGTPHISTGPVEATISPADLRANAKLIETLAPGSEFVVKAQGAGIITQDSRALNLSGMSFKVGFLGYGNAIEVEIDTAAGPLQTNLSLAQVMYALARRDVYRISNPSLGVSSKNDQAYEAGDSFEVLTEAAGRDLQAEVGEHLVILSVNTFGYGSQPEVVKYMVMFYGEHSQSTSGVIHTTHTSVFDTWQKRKGIKRVEKAESDQRAIDVTDAVGDLAERMTALREAAERDATSGYYQYTGPDDPSPEELAQYRQLYEQARMSHEQQRQPGLPPSGLRRVREDDSQDESLTAPAVSRERIPGGGGPGWGPGGLWARLAAARSSEAWDIFNIGEEDDAGNVWVEIQRDDEWAMDNPGLGYDGDLEAAQDNFHDVREDDRRRGRVWARRPKTPDAEHKAREFEQWAGIPPGALSTPTAQGGAARPKPGDFGIIEGFRAVQFDADGGIPWVQPRIQGSTPEEVAGELKRRGLTAPIWLDKPRGSRRHWTPFEGPPGKWSCGHKRQQGDAQCPVCATMYGRKVTSMTTMTTWERIAGQLDEHALRELELYAENTSELYTLKKRVINVTKALLARGQMPTPDIWTEWVERAAARYIQEFGDNDGDVVFPPEVRRALTENLNERYTEAVLGGEYGPVGVGPQASASRVAWPLRKRANSDADDIAKEIFEDYIRANSEPPQRGDAQDFDYDGTVSQAADSHCSGMSDSQLDDILSDARREGCERDAVEEGLMEVSSADDCEKIKVVSAILSLECMISAELDRLLDEWWDAKDDEESEEDDDDDEEPNDAAQIAALQAAYDQGQQAQAGATPPPTTPGEMEAFRMGNYDMWGGGFGPAPRRTRRVTSIDPNGRPIIAQRQKRAHSRFAANRKSPEWAYGRHQGLSDLRGAGPQEVMRTLSELKKVLKEGPGLLGVPFSMPSGMDVNEDFVAGYGSALVSDEVTEAWRKGGAWGRVATRVAHVTERRAFAPALAAAAEWLVTHPQVVMALLEAYPVVKEHLKAGDGKLTLEAAKAIVQAVGPAVVESLMAGRAVT